MQKELICIGCPLGCNLTVEIRDDKVLSVTGNTCRRGDIYARNEITDPRRIVTSTVKVTGGSVPVVSCKTAQAIPKGDIGECLKQLKEVSVQAPVMLGDVLTENIAGSGIDVIATKTVF